jgi:hypothetical protein
VFVSIGKGDRVSRKRLSDNAIGEIVKRYAAAAGYDPKAFAGHSLRAGFVTSALEHGADMFRASTPLNSPAWARAEGDSELGTRL